MAQFISIQTESAPSLTPVSSNPTPQKTPQTTTNGNYQTDWNGQDSLQTKDYNYQTDTSKQVANYS
jgi:hypothetical protein